MDLWGNPQGITLNVNVWATLTNLSDTYFSLIKQHAYSICVYYMVVTVYLVRHSWFVFCFFLFIYIVLLLPLIVVNKASYIKRVKSPKTFQKFLA